MFCLDTNIVIGIMTGRRPQAARRLEAELSARAPILIPAIVLLELRYGAFKSAYPQRNHARIDDFLVAMDKIPALDDEDAETAAEIRAYLERNGSPIGLFDILIAAQTRRRNATLVTANRREFERVPGLMVTDW